jgi:hypothetical protein
MMVLDAAVVDLTINLPLRWATASFSVSPSSPPMKGRVQTTVSTCWAWPPLYRARSRPNSRVTTRQGAYSGSMLSWSVAEMFELLVRTVPAGGVSVAVLVSTGGVYVPPILATTV